MLGPFSDENLFHLAIVNGLDLHGCLVGLDLGNDVASAHGIALADMPLDEFTLLHSWGERWH